MNKTYDHYRKEGGIFYVHGSVGKRLIPFATKLFKPPALDSGAGVINDMREGLL